MKKLVLFGLIFCTALCFTACLGQTELTLENSTESEGAINDIKWLAKDSSTSDVEWQKAGGYALGNKTEAKAVTVINGEIQCVVDAGVGFVEADVYVQNDDGSKTQSIALAEGSSNEYTINATTAKK